MTQSVGRGINGTEGLGYWTHEPDVSLPLAQLVHPFPWASPGRATSIHTYIHTSGRTNKMIFLVNTTFTSSLFQMSQTCYGDIGKLI